jgi:hypothetical protein
MTIPLEADLQKSIVEVKKVTSQLRNSLADVYATYAATFYLSIFCPYLLLQWF